MKGRNAMLYHNNGNSNHWMVVKRVGVTNNHAGIGARVTVTANIQGLVRQQVREIASGSGFGGQNSLEAHFGLGDATRIIALGIQWPSGFSQVFTDLGVDSRLTIHENSSGVWLNIFTNSPQIPTNNYFDVLGTNHIELFPIQAGRP